MIIKEKRWVYGTRTEKWYLVGREDRDWSTAISQKEMKLLSKKEALRKYLSPTQI